MSKNLAGIEDQEYWSDRPLNDPRMDWRNGAGNWVDEYWSSVNHPHRKVIIESLKSLECFNSVFEVGCNCGPNLKLIQDNFPDVRLSGIDLSDEAIKKGQEMLPDAKLSVADVVAGRPFLNSYDVILADACLMYVKPEDIEGVMDELAVMANKAVIIVDWYAPDSKEGVVNEHHWCRNYEKLLRERGFKVEKKKITEDLWPSKNWSTLGYIFTAVRQ